MRYFETRPSPDLAPYVHCVWELEDGEGGAFAEPIFPDGRVEIVVHLADRPAPSHASTPQPEVMAVGQMTAALWLAPVTRLHAVGIRFTPAGARAWLDVPQHELTDRVHAVDDLAVGVARRLRAAVLEGTTPRARFQRIERVLRETMRAQRGAASAIEHAVRLTLARQGRVTVDALARACGMSARHLERGYLDGVGLTPKALARTVRFQGALRDLKRGVPAAAAACANGFADQPHLAREFRRFAGVPAGSINLADVAFVQDGPLPAAAD